MCIHWDPPRSGDGAVQSDAESTGEGGPHGKDCVLQSYLCPCCSSVQLVVMMMGDPEWGQWPWQWERAFCLYNPGQNVFPLSQAQTVHTASCWKAFSHHWPDESLFLCFLHLILGTPQGNGYKNGGGQKYGWNPCRNRTLRS